MAAGGKFLCHLSGLEQPKVSVPQRGIFFKCVFHFISQPVTHPPSFSETLRLLPPPLNQSVSLQCTPDMGVTRPHKKQRFGVQVFFKTESHFLPRDPLLLRLFLAGGLTLLFG